MILSYRNINDISQDVTLADNDNIFAPVDIESLLNRMFGITIEYYTLHPAGLILGMCSNQPQVVKVKDGENIIYAQLNDKVIFIDSSLKEIKAQGRRLFTIAHEGAHLYLFFMEGRKDALAHRYLRENSVSRNFDWDEWQADTMASCLLMPEANVRYVFNLFFQCEHIDKITPFRKDEYFIFNEIADFFGVSKTAMAIRLKKLNLIDSFDFSKSIDIRMEA